MSKDDRKTRKDQPKKTTNASPPKSHGPVRFGVKSWQTGKPRLTAEQLKGKSRKVH